MSNDLTQISVDITSETKHRLEAYVQAQGLEKSFFIEAALLHYLKALEELPTDIAIPPKIVVSADVGEKILAAMDTPPESTSIMKALFGHG